ncbi:MAG TPA: RICIN domain-containing protein [Fibrobacteria bacterium]|nr:RICIN domain-containing protein [Fibrobacteria bacterium]
MNDSTFQTPRHRRLALGLFRGGAAFTLAGLISGCNLNDNAPAEERPQLATAASIVTTSFKDATGRIEIKIKTCDPTAAAATNCAYCTVDDGWARIGGGGQILGESNPGAMLQASYPDPNFFTQANAHGCTGPAGNPAQRINIDDRATWVARSSGATHQLQAYVIEMRMLGNNGLWFRPPVTEGRDNVTSSVNPPANWRVETTEQFQANPGQYLIGGGAYIFKGDGNLNQATPTNAYLVGSYPVDGTDGRAWRAVARSQANPAPFEVLKSYGIFMDACPAEISPTCINYPTIRSVSSATTSGYGTSTLFIPDFQVNGSIGGYAAVSSGGARYLADLIPFNGSRQGFTVRSKAFTTGTGATLGYALTFGLPFDIYTAVYNHSQKCMGVLNSRTDATAPVVQQTCTFGDEPSNVRFAMVPQPGGYVSLKFEHSGYCVDISGGSKLDNAPAVQYPCSGNDNQLVQLVNNPNGSHSFKFKHSGKCLDVPGSSTADGTQFIQYTCNSQSANQAFHFDD